MPDSSRRFLPTRRPRCVAHGRDEAADKVKPCVQPFDQEYSMPIILWLLGVPLSVVLLLMLFGVV